MSYLIYILNVAAALLYFITTTTILIFPLLKNGKKEKIIDRTIIIGFSLHTLSIIVTIVHRGLFPALNLTEALFLISWTAFGIIFIINILYKPRLARLVILPIIFIMYLISLESGTQEVTDNYLFSHPLFPVHVFFSIIGEATFLIAFLLGIFFFIESYSLKNKKLISIFGYLPSLEALEEAIMRLFYGGFLCISVGLITGIIWISLDKNLHFDTNPKLIFMMMSWFFYGSIILAKHLLTLRGKRIAYTAIFGFILILCTFFGAYFTNNWHSF